MKKKVFAVILAAAAFCGSLSPAKTCGSELVSLLWHGMECFLEVLDSLGRTGCRVVFSILIQMTMLKVSMAKAIMMLVIADDYILKKIIEEGLPPSLTKKKSPILKHQSLSGDSL